MKKSLPFILTSLLALSGLGLISNQVAQSVSADREMSLASEGDAFKLHDVSYTEDESFVYTADLHFKGGQAGGLAFGAEENDHYYVVNMDRYENHVKLLYFASNGNGGYVATELRSDYFIGNDKLTNEERNFINPQIRGIENVNLKVILTREDEHAYMEFFVEGIKRFGVDTDIDLNDLGTSFHYEGGYLGMNCFNGDVYINHVEIGHSDYSYFSEPYRNQYHFQPFAKWSNDPNALCYYNGWYHVFYQYHPYNLYWGSMYWGHARSRDLIHFEYLPLCLFPETESQWGPGDGYMWSGCAITYTEGMVPAIDAWNWFPNGNGNGLLAIFTRDGGLQDQILISSDDEGLTWTKRYRIPQDVIGIDYKVDLRDPKVFPLQKDGSGKVTTWGMTLSSYNLNKGWFLRSTNLLTWYVAGEFPLPTPECIGIGFVKDQFDETHAYLTNKSRTYILGDLSYNEMSGKVTFTDENGVDISTYTVDNIPLKPLDFGPDSYASQSFYINDPASEFYGKDIVMNWFSGDLNASFCTGPGEYAGLRERWNGGFTTPVEYKVFKDSQGYRLSQTPITLNNTNLTKENVVTINNQELTSNSENPLSDVHTHIFELQAEITTNNNSPITFKVDVGENEYMQLGWNETDGYYVDRTYLDDKGIATNIDWHTKYTSHIMGDTSTKSFYVLSDNGGLEVFCENYSVPFYFVTTASIYSTEASLFCDDAVINHLELNEIESAYKVKDTGNEGILYVSSNDVSLDTQFLKAKFVTCYFSGHADLEWEELENDEVVSYTTSNQGINLVVLKDGEASFKVSAGNQEAVINVTVYHSNFESDLNFKKENIISGSWLMGEGMIKGEKASGNAFILAEEVGDDFTYTGQFSIKDGVAASLVFRAASDMSKYLVANYDSNEKVVKLWSTNGELARSAVLDLDKSNIVLSVKANGKDIQVIANGNMALNHTLNDNEPLSGHYGLNVFSATAEFKSLSILKENYEYTSGELAVNLVVDQFITAIYNVTKGNARVESGFYHQASGVLYIRSEYFELLDTNGLYEFRVVGSSYSMNIKVNVNITRTFVIDDISVEKGSDINVNIGNHEVTSVSVNGETLASTDYSVKDYVLHINGKLFKDGDNEVVVNGNVSFNVEVKNMNEEIVVPADDKQPSSFNPTPLVVAGIVGGSILGVLVLLALIAGVVILVVVLKKKRGKAK